MKYVFISVAALAVTFGIAYLIARFVIRRVHSAHKKRGTAILTAIFGIVLILGIALGYMSVYYHAGESALTAMQGSESVSVREIDGGYFFDGPSDSAAIVFYPGAKVDSVAYAPLMLKLAERGYDCFLAEMPFRFALLGEDTAEAFIDAYSYDTWIMAGHSMGGIVAAGFANENTDRIDGVILLASYSTEKIDERLKLCSIYGSEDGCLEIGVYTDMQKNWPEQTEEIVIDGGNHAHFGDYGVQKGDGTAKIAEEDQQAFAADAIADFFA